MKGRNDGNPQKQMVIIYSYMYIYNIDHFIYSKSNVLSFSDS